VDTEFKVGDLTVKIEQDENPGSPREDWDNLGTMVCFHRRYNLGDKHEYHASDFSGWGDARERFVKQGAAIILPLYLYDHSGLRMKVGSFQGLLPGGHAEFDSGQVGFIYVTKEKLREEYSTKRITKKILEKAEKVLRSEVETYDQFLSGDVWGYTIEDQEGEHVDSCWGFYGFDHCKKEATDVAQNSLKRRDIEIARTRRDKYARQLEARQEQRAEGL
jgi:hypothetical protein